MEVIPMKRAIALLAIGAAAGLTAERIAAEMRKPGAQQFLWVRRQVNERVNPLLLQRDLVGTGRAEIATLEHVGRRSGAVHLTPVHPTLRDDAVYVPAPMGVGSQWAQNVLAAGTARLQLHDTVYELDAPELIAPSETGFYPPPLAAPFDRLGWRYVRMHVAGSAPGSLTPAA
jgi:hypothetical protein